MTLDLAAGGLGVLRYLGFALMVAAGGTGVLTLMRCRDRLVAPVYLGPAVMLAVWTVVLSGAAWLRIPLTQVTPGLWLATLALATVGVVTTGTLSRVRRRRLVRPGPAVLCLVLPLLVLPGVVLYGLPDFAGSDAADSWSYVATADYLRYEVRGANAGMIPLHQYAAHLADTRNATSSLLAFLAPALPGGRADTAVNLFCLLAVFSFAGAVVHFGQTLFGRRGPPTLALLVLALTGWPGNVVLAGNFDQLLVMPLLPALAAVAARIGQGASFGRLSLLAGLLIAAAFYSYIELAVLGVPVAASLWCEGNRRPGPALLRAAGSIALAGATALLLLLPAADTLVPFFLSQLGQGIVRTGGRPGEGYFPGLTEPSFLLSALWSAGGEHRLAVTHYPGQVLAAILSACALAGAVRLRRRPLPLLAGLGVLALTGMMIVRNDYSYGAYKIISINFWLFAWLAVTGLMTVPLDRSPWLAHWRPRQALGLTLAAVLVPLVALRLMTVEKVGRFSDFARLVHQAREAGAAVRRLTGGAPVLVSVDDGQANQWAVYQLSPQPMRIAPYRVYMAQPHVLPFMAAARPVGWDTIAFVLTDQRRGPVPVAVENGRRVWANAHYALWAVPPGHWTTLAGVANPNGLEEIGGHPFVWLGGGTTGFEVVAAAPGEAVLSAAITPGPRSVTGAGPWRLAVTAGTWHTEVAVTESGLHLRLPLSAGLTMVTLSVLDPLRPAPPAGDRRPMVLGLAGYRLDAAD